MWQKDFSGKEAVWVDISENSETVMVQGWGIANFFNREGTLLLTMRKYMATYFLSPNGEYIIEKKGDSPTEIYCYNLLGERIELSLPEKFNAPLYYARFTDDSNILALFIGQRTEPPPLPLKNRGRQRKGFFKEPLPGIETDGHLILYDLNKNEFGWSTKLGKGEFGSLGFETQHTAVSKDHILLFIGNEEGYGLYCYTKNGDHIWRKSEQEIHSGRKMNPTSMLISKNGDKACVYGGRGDIYIFEMETGNADIIMNLPLDIVRRIKLKIIDFDDKKILFSRSNPEKRTQDNFIINLNPKGKAESSSFIEGSLFTNKGKIFFFDANSNLNICRIGEYR